MTIQCKGEELLLCKERAIYWKAKQTLIISDLHIGKAAFFRKSGIQVPLAVGQTDLERLGELLNLYKPLNLLITGDMFHNYMNNDVLEFKQWRSGFPEVNFQLIKGNHDALKERDYADLNIAIFEKELIIGPFRFIHDQPEIFDDFYPISGHVHPGVTIYGRARQQLRLACFCFGDNYAVLPAFSVFTGLSMIKPGGNDCIYAITPTQVVKI